MPKYPIASTLATCLLLSLFGAPQTMADAAQSHESIRQAVRGHLQALHQDSTAEVEIEIDRLDRRLRLSRCNTPLETFAPRSKRSSGRLTVGVRCNGDKPWSLYVPGRLSLFEQVVVATREIPRGSRIGPDDLSLQRRDLSRLQRGYFLNPDQVLGQAAKRRITRDRPLSPGLVEIPPAVTRGSRVSIIAVMGGIEARTAGIALSDGRPGERIRIENRNTERELEARVVSAGLVRVDI